MTTQRSRMMGTRGVVKFFNPGRGFGFITPEGGGKEVFFHHSAIQIEGVKSLNEGDLVEFDVVEEERGPKAANVVRLPERDEEEEAEDQDEDDDSSPFQSGLY
jgi:CspA family cold shock protein